MVKNVKPFTDIYAWQSCYSMLAVPISSQKASLLPSKYRGLKPFLIYSHPILFEPARDCFDIAFI